ncbi:hypothetical protein ACJX0J_006367, partial [Zea mays]
FWDIFVISSEATSSSCWGDPLSDIFVILSEAYAHPDDRCLVLVPVAATQTLILFLILTHSFLKYSMNM